MQKPMAATGWKLQSDQEIVSTSDGSCTLFSERYGEHYHSVRCGAFQESLYKHVRPAFSQQKQKSHMKILDICFGLGYNTLVTLYYLKERGFSGSVEIHAPELDRELVKGLMGFEYPKEVHPFRQVLHALCDEGSYRDEHIQAEIHFGDAREVIPELDGGFDIVYQDPFSPQKNPELWTLEYFKILASKIAPSGILTTYSQASKVRMGLHMSGFHIYKHQPELPELKEGTIATLGVLPGYEMIDMNLKKERNPQLVPLLDRGASKELTSRGDDFTSEEKFQ